MSLHFPKADVFIAYKREDRALVDRIAAALKANGHSVVTDFDVPASANFGDAIESMIREAQLVLVVWTAAATKSPWVKAEAQLAFSLGRYMGLRLEDVMPPFMLAGEQMIVPADASLPAVELARIVAQLRTRLAPGAPQPAVKADSAQASADLQRAALEQGAWQIALKAGKPADFEKFLRLYPGSVYADEALAAFAAAKTPTGKAKRALGAPDLMGLMAVLAVIVGLVQLIPGTDKSAEAAAALETAAPTPVAEVQSPPAAQPDEPVAEVLDDAAVAAAIKSAAEEAARVTEPTAKAADWVLHLSKNDIGRLLGTYACGAGVSIGGNCVGMGATSIYLGSLGGIEALPLLQKLEEVNFGGGLNLSSMTAADWATLQYLPALTSLNLASTNFSDLRQISGLKGLRVLNISNSAVRDLGPVAGLTALSELSCGSNEIVDISALSQLPDLRVRTRSRVIART